jgi:hypothetical protein
MNGLILKYILQGLHYLIQGRREFFAEAWT